MKNNLGSEFSQRLEGLLNKKGWTNTIFAQHANIHINSVTKYLKGNLPAPEQLLKIAKALNVATDYLLGHSCDHVPENNNLNTFVATPASADRFHRTDDIVKALDKIAKICARIENRLNKAVIITDEKVTHDGP